MACSTRSDPLCTGRWTWSHSVGTASMASMMSRPKSRGCEVVKRTRLMPGTSPTAASSSAKVLFHAECCHLAGFGEHRIRGAAAFFSAREGDNAVGAEFVAALDDGDVPAMRVGSGGEFGLETLVGFAVVESSDADQAAGFRFPVFGFQLSQHLRQVAV